MRVGVADTEREPVDVPETDRVTVPVGETDIVLDGVFVTDPVLLTDLDRVGVTVADHVKEAFAELDGDPEPLRVIVPDADTDRDIVPVGETV